MGRGSWTTGLTANPSRQASERAFFAYYRPRHGLPHSAKCSSNQRCSSCAASPLTAPPSIAWPRLVLRRVLLQRFMNFFSVCDDVCCFSSKTSATVLSLATPQKHSKTCRSAARPVPQPPLPLLLPQTDVQQKIAKLNISRVFYLACCCYVPKSPYCAQRERERERSELAGDAVRAATAATTLCNTHTHTQRRRASSRLQ